MIAAGFGFSSQATADSLRDAFAKAAQGQKVTHLAVPKDKVGFAPFERFCAQAALPVVGIAPEQLASVETISHSARSQAERATGSVAEASALAATGGWLLAPRFISDDRMATCAIAIGDHE